MSSNAFLWLRNDLRILDQPLLSAKAADAQAWIYVFDKRFLSRSVGLPGNIGAVQKASARRALFLLQSIRDLSQRLRDQLGADLIVRVGEPEIELSKVAEQLNWRAWDVHCQEELGTEERSVRDKVALDVIEKGGKFHASWGMQFLYHPEDVKAALSEDPAAKLINPHHFWQEDADPESLVPIRHAGEGLGSSSNRGFLQEVPVEIMDPCGLLSLPNADALLHLGYSAEEAQEVASGFDARAVLPFEGGESKALARLETWIVDGGLARYYDDRSGLLGADYSSKLSPWLAAGCISPVRVYRRIRRENYDDSVKWLISELGWRDLFKYHVLFHGSKVFQIRGPANTTRPWARDKHLYEAWCSGQTGISYIDAHMRELAISGFMSNTGRQLVAAFLSCCLGLDWRLGAMWFESKLIDHDVCLNYGNWNREARVRWAGRHSEPDAHDIFSEEHIHLMARLSNAADGGPGPYDTATFIKRWLPELEDAGGASLLCRKSPAPIYKILCSICSSLDKSSVYKDGKILCSWCRQACAWCGCSVPADREKGVKRKLYCGKCWGDST